MTNTVYPTDAVAGSPSYSGRKLRQTIAALAAGGRPARPLGGLSGIRPNSGVIGSATATTWTVTPHAGQLDLEAAAEAGVYLYAVDANVTGAVTAADANNPRVDIVYVRLSDPAEGDGTAAPGITVSYTQGVPAAAPVAPGAPTRALVLFTIAVPKVGGGAPSVTMACPEVGGAGAPIGVRSKAQRDALTPFLGQVVRRLDANGRLEAWNSTAWVPLGPPTIYSSVGGTPPVGPVGNPAGTILQTLTIPAVEFARTLDVDMSAFVATNTPADVWEVVGTVDSANVTVGVCGRSRLPSPTPSASGSFSCKVAQAANAAVVLRVWCRRISGAGTGTGSTDETYTRIDVSASPVP